MREVRHREPSGHQTPVLSTDYKRLLDQAAVALFARWCQENFFKDMGEQSYSQCPGGGMLTPTSHAAPSFKTEAGHG